MLEKPPKGSDDGLVGGSSKLTVLDKSFNSSSNLSKSAISTFVEALAGICLSFIRSSTPGPKFTEG